MASLARRSVHPLTSPVPRALEPLGRLARRVVLARLASAAADRRVELVLPDGRRVALGQGERAAVLRVHDDRAFARMLWRGELGAGEGYTAGDWDADDLPAALGWFLRATGAGGVESPMTWLAQLPTRWRHQRAANDRAGSARNIYAHYDLGNAFYQTFLDAQLVYSCALWRDGAADLAAAQTAKLERLCALAGIICLTACIALGPLV